MHACTLIDLEKALRQVISRLEASMAAHLALHGDDKATQSQVLRRLGGADREALVEAVIAAGNGWNPFTRAARTRAAQERLATLDASIEMSPAYIQAVSEARQDGERRRLISKGIIELSVKIESLGAALTRLGPVLARLGGGKVVELPAPLADIDADVLVEIIESEAADVGRMRASPAYRPSPRRHPVVGPAVSAPSGSASSGSASSGPASSGPARPAPSPPAGTPLVSSQAERAACAAMVTPRRRPAVIEGGKVWLPIPREQWPAGIALGGRQANEDGVYVARRAVWPARLEAMLPLAEREVVEPILPSPIPASSWGASLANMLTRESWERVRGPHIDKWGRRCRICGERSPDGSVDAHEIWEYTIDDGMRPVQRLHAIVPLCKECHGMFHLGREMLMGGGGWSYSRLIHVNRWTAAEGEMWMRISGEAWRQRSSIAWTLDLSILGGLSQPPTLILKMDQEEARKASFFGVPWKVNGAPRANEGPKLPL